MLLEDVIYLSVCFCPQKSLFQTKGENQSQIRQREKEVKEVKQALASLQVNV